MVQGLLNRCRIICDAQDSLEGGGTHNPNSEMKQSVCRDISVGPEKERVMTGDWNIVHMHSICNYFPVVTLICIVLYIIIFNFVCFIYSYVIFLFSDLTEYLWLTLCFLCLNYVNKKMRLFESEQVINLDPYIMVLHIRVWVSDFFEISVAHMPHWYLKDPPLPRLEDFSLVDALTSW